VQVVGDLADRLAPVDVGAEDLAHDLGLGLEDLDPRRAAVVGHHAAMAVGHLPEEDLAGAGAVELSAAVALGDLGALVSAITPCICTSSVACGSSPSAGPSRKRTATPKRPSSSRTSTW
jgi:hypothetical protein